MTNKDHALKCADYVIGGQYEYERMVEEAIDSFKDGNSRKNTREMLKDTYFYSASVLLHGRRDAGKALTEIMLEAKPVGGVWRSK